MNSLVTHLRQLLPFAVYLAIVLYFVVLIALTILRFGLDGVSINNIKQVVFSRTMIVLFCVYLILIFLHSVDRTFFLKELHERIESQKRQYDEWMKQYDEWKREKEEQKEKGIEKETKKKGEENRKKKVSGKEKTAMLESGRLMETELPRAVERTAF